uniref:Uncharacterized protein n=1 Tax=Buteo japonicus TaxID=224669 RepID=A0A8C0B656_9AVES
LSTTSLSLQQWATFARAWYLLDAKMQPPGKIAAATVIRLEGRHKPIYHALSEYCSRLKQICFPSLVFFF